MRNALAHDATHRSHAARTGAWALPSITTTRTTTTGTGTGTRWRMRLGVWD
jgi:hypothetical protein